MDWRRSWQLRRLLTLLAAAWLALVGCRKQQTTAPAPEAPRPLLPDEYGATDHRPLSLPSNWGKRTGDLDEMVRARAIRALVILDPIGFFFLSGRPHGIQFESLQEFERFANQKLKTGNLPIRVAFIPMRPDQLEAALTHGLGDFIAYPVVITPDREQRVAFSIPVKKGVSQIVVTGSALANITSFDSLAGEPVYANPLTTYYENLKRESVLRVQAGRPPLDIRAADQHLYDDDLIQMVNAGILPATATTRGRADLWAQVLPNVTANPELTIANEGDAAWVIRKDTPHLKQLLDEFLKDYGEGTTFKNTLLLRYLQDTKWIRNSISPEELRTFVAYQGYFKKYSAQYSFDYLMIAAQGYEESLLDQSKRSPAGAVGVMQVIPRIAAAEPINIPDVSNADDNIHAGTKIMRHIAEDYFADPAIDPVNRALLTFASYNAGPTRIAHLRRKAQSDGLDPNVWFDNVELEVAKDVGEETIIYVGNIFKYYVAYTLAAADRERRGLPVSFK
jgi:membrane-bound lytic murein transglycosylase MltF